MPSTNCYAVSMQLPERLKRFAFVSAALIGFAFALGFVVLVVAVLSAVAFSGSTGDSWQRAIERLAPIALFSGGAYVCAGLLALINAIATPRGAWVKTVLLAAIAGGITAALNDTVGRLLMTLTKPVLSLLGKVFLNH